jgi:hypothetical protein
MSDYKATLPEHPDGMTNGVIRDVIELGQVTFAAESTAVLKFARGDPTLDVFGNLHVGKFFVTATRGLKL